MSHSGIKIKKVDHSLVMDVEQQTLENNLWL